MLYDETNFKLSMEDISALKLMKGKVLVEVFDTRAKVGNIHILITDENPFVPDRGKVFKVADDVCLNIGDYVIIEKYKGKRIFSDDNRQFILLDKYYILSLIK